MLIVQLLGDTALELLQRERFRQHGSAGATNEARRLGTVQVSGHEHDFPGLLRVAGHDGAA